jgi:hypothetical protein
MMSGGLIANEHTGGRAIAPLTHLQHNLFAIA